MDPNNPGSLREVLLEFKGVHAPGGVTKSTIDRAAMQRRLDMVEKRCQQQHMIWLAILAIAFVFAIVLVWIFIDNPKHAAAVLGATGLTVGAVLPKLRDVEREISRVRLFSALATGVSEAQLAGIVAALVPHL